MDIQALINLVTNAGFPAALCFVLLKYVLQNMEKQITQISDTMKELTEAVNRLHRSTLVKINESDGNISQVQNKPTE